MVATQVLTTYRQPLSWIASSAGVAEIREVAQFQTWRGVPQYEPLRGVPQLRTFRGFKILPGRGDFQCNENPQRPDAPLRPRPCLSRRNSGEVTCLGFSELCTSARQLFTALHPQPNSNICDCCSLGRCKDESPRHAQPIRSAAPRGSLCGARSRMAR